MCNFKFLRGLFSVFLLFAAPACNAEPWEFEWNQNSGISASFNKMLINYGSQLVCASPDFKRHYYYPPKISFKITKAVDLIAVKSDDKSPSPFFVEEHSVAAGSSAELTIKVKGILKEDIAAVVQNVVFFIPENIANGATLVTDGSSIAVGAKPVTYAKTIRDISIVTIYGTINLTVVNGPGVNLQDRRDKPYAGKRGLLFITSQKISGNQTFEQTVKISAGKDFKTFVKLPEYSGKPVQFQTVPTLPPQAAAESTPVSPLPKSLAFSGGVLSLPADLTLSISGAAPDDEKRLADAAGRALHRAGIQAKLDQTGANGFINISINPAAADSGKYDYYELKADNTVSIIAATPAGAFYALQTLSQLIEKSGIRRVSVTDYADMKIRAVQLSTADRDVLKLLLPLIEEIYAPLKINTVFLFCQNINLPSIPELHNARKMQPGQIAVLDDVCRNNYITLNPLIETYGHMEWLLNHSEYKDLAEDPDKPFACNVSNPRTFEVMTKLFDDVLKMFPHAEYLHVGNDEVANRGRYPFRPENISTPPWQLFLKNQKFCEDYAQRRKIKLMVWQDKPVHGDMSKSIFSRAWQDFARDTAVAVWDYDVRADFPDAELFKKQGHATFGATGMHRTSDPLPAALNNLSSYARYARTNGLDGMIQTTWTGLENCSDVLFAYSPQYWLHAEAACVFWNVSYIPRLYPDSKGSCNRERFDAAVSRIAPETYIFNGKERISYIDISKFLNVFLSAPGLKTDDWQPNEIYGTAGGMFNIAGCSGKPLAALVKKDNPLAVSFSRPPKAVSLLWASSGSQALMSKVGMITVKSRDGVKVTPILIGKEILPSAAEIQPRATVHSMLSPSGFSNLSQYTMRLPADASSMTVTAESPIIIAAVSVVE